MCVVKEQRARGREGEKVTLFSYHVAGQQIDLTLPLVNYHTLHSLSHTLTADTVLEATLEESFYK